MDKRIPFRCCRFLRQGPVKDDIVEFHCEALSDTDCNKSTDKRVPDTRCVCGPYTVTIRDPREDY